MLFLDPDEHVLLEVRRHWFVFATEAILHLAIAVFPFLAYDILIQFPPFAELSKYGNGKLITFFYALWFLILWISFFLQWTKYYLDVWYVTEKRIIDIDQKRLFSRTVSNLRFDKIQDITVEISGLVSTFLNIGDIKVQTAAEDSGDFFMHRAANPDKVRTFIFSQHNIAAEKYIPEKPVSSTGNANQNTHESV